MLAAMTTERAKNMMDEGYHCSQVVACHAAECLGLDKDYMITISSGFGGGCNHGDSCGVVIGAILALSLVYGTGHVDEQRDAVMKEKVREFTGKFVAVHKSTLCRDLLDGYDNADPNRVSKETTWDNCPGYCHTACEILDEMIGDRY